MVPPQSLKLHLGFWPQLTYEQKPLSNQEKTQESITNKNKRDVKDKQMLQQLNLIFFTDWFLGWVVLHLFPLYCSITKHIQLNEFTHRWFWHQVFPSRPTSILSHWSFKINYCFLSVSILWTRFNCQEWTTVGIWNLSQYAESLAWYSSSILQMFFQVIIEVWS